MSDTTATSHPPKYFAAMSVAYVVVLCAVILSTFFYKVRVDGILACPATGYGDYAYLSDCQASAYGDYDHGAFWFQLEREAADRAAQADVLFVGNSRVQFALSPVAADAWAAAIGASHYLLGFSHSETAMFFGPLLDKLKPRARVYVINVDRFFDDRISPPAGQLLPGRGEESRYRDKQSAQLTHRRLCTAVPALCGHAFAVFRVRENGHWTTSGTPPSGARDVSDGPAGNADRWAEFAVIGEKFVSRLPVDRECVVLMLVPTVATKRAEATAIADKLGMPLVAPQVSGLRTFDGSHLDADSARRWSEAFLTAAGPQIRKCLAGAPARGG